MEGFRKHIDLILDDLNLIIERIDGNVSVLDHPQIPRAQHRFIEPGGRVDARIFEQVPRQILAKHLVVGNAGVERANQVVAVPPSHRKPEIPLATVRLAVAYPVHPVARPVFPEAIRIEQPVDQFYKGGRRLAMDKRLHLFGARR